MPLVFLKVRPTAQPLHSPKFLNSQANLRTFKLFFFWGGGCDNIHRSTLNYRLVAAPLVILELCIGRGRDRQIKHNTISRLESKNKIA